MRRSGSAALFYALAAAFVATACFHAAAALRPALDPSAPRWRHLLFVALNLGCAAGLVRRPRWFVWAFAALTAQQLHSHGGAFVASLRGPDPVDFLSLGVVVFMLVALALLVADRRGSPGAPA